MKLLQLNIYFKTYNDLNGVLFLMSLHKIYRENYNT